MNNEFYRKTFDCYSAFLNELAKQEDKFVKERDLILNDSCFLTCLEDFSLINRAIFEIRELQEKVADFKSVLKKLRK